MWKSYIPRWTTHKIPPSIFRWYSTAYRVRNRGEYLRRITNFAATFERSWWHQHSFPWISTTAAASLVLITALENGNVSNDDISLRFCSCEGKSTKILPGDNTESSSQTTDPFAFLSSALQASFDSEATIPPLVKEWIKGMTTESSECTAPGDFQEILLQLLSLVAMAKQQIDSQLEDLKKDHPLPTIKDDGITDVVSKFLEAIASQRSLLAQLPSGTPRDQNTTDDTPQMKYSSTEDTTSIQDIIHFIDTYHDDIHDIVSTYMSEIDYKRITPTALLYYSEYRNSQSDTSVEKRTLKNPVRWLEDWPTVDVFNWNSVIETEDDDSESYILENDALVLSKLAYADTIDEIRTGLSNIQSACYEYELLDCDLKSSPGQPAHFSAIRKNKSPLHRSSDERDVVLVVRGTKSIADAITDVLCDTKPYRNGFAHSLILDGGRYIANKYRPMLSNLFPTANKINVHIYGHSLGAGTGAIAAIELNTTTKANPREPTIRATMIGYGCPAILSANLIGSTQDYITTVVNDSDLVPRLSGITLTNVLYDIIEFNWLPYAQRDIQYVLYEMQKRQPLIFTNEVIESIYKKIEPIVASVFHDTYLEHGSIPRRKVELFPPGRCIHLYRSSPDKKAISRVYVPNSFYSSIEVNKRMIADHLLDTGYAKILRPTEENGHESARFDCDSGFPCSFED